MTGQQLADRLGIHFSTASRLKDGHRLPSLDLMFRIEKAFGVSIEEQAKARKRGPKAYSRLIRRIMDDAA